MPYPDRNWQDFCTLVDRAELREDPRSSSNGARHRHMAALQSILAEITPSRTVAEWQELCRSADIAIQEVLDLDDLDASEYARSRQTLRRRRHPSEGDYLSIRFPIDFSRTPADTSRPAPRLGEHTGRRRTTPATAEVAR
jgi:crotonobetainyl-CoA:carnitine CoA-transferase CaiB-like acyl-CoA transferase